jgi:hypothetical protein
MKYCTNIEDTYEIGERISKALGKRKRKQSIVKISHFYFDRDLVRRVE